MTLTLLPAPPPAVRPPEPTAPAAPPPPTTTTGDRLRVGGLVFSSTAVAVGVISLVWSAVLTGEMGARAAELRRNGLGRGACLGAGAPPECTDLYDAETRSITLSDAGVTSLVAGGAIGAVTLASFLVSREGAAERRSRVQLAPMVGRQAGLMAHGVW